MIKQWLSLLNYIVSGAIIVLLVFTCLIWMKRPNEIESSEIRSKKRGLPQLSFEVPPEAYEKIDSPLLALAQAPPTMQIPDLKQQMVYYGRNGRPDAQSDQTVLHFSTIADKTVISCKSQEKLYLFYDRSSTPSRYVFSPDNAPTSLWIEAEPVDNEVRVKVFLTNDKGEFIKEPANFKEFSLPEKELNRVAGNTWEIGTFKVDGTLLARQKARWCGPDRFLEHHGGEEYQHTIGKQRIDFSDADNIYSVFVKVGDSLIWDGEHWKPVNPGEESLGHPLMVVKKIDDRITAFELWDVEGKGKITLNLLKSTEPWTVQNGQILQPMFKFVGAKTRTQSVFEINRERVVLNPSDWLLLTPKGWVKLNTAGDIDDYVKRKKNGTLFVFEGIERKDEKQMMKGLLYSPSRHDFSQIEIPLQLNTGKMVAAKDVNENKGNKNGKEMRDQRQSKLVPVPRLVQAREKNAAENTSPHPAEKTSNASSSSHPPKR
jgi:hypothetical protein